MQDCPHQNCPHQFCPLFLHPINFAPINFAPCEKKDILPPFKFFNFEKLYLLNNGVYIIFLKFIAIFVLKKIKKSWIWRQQNFPLSYRSIHSFQIILIHNVNEEWIIFIYMWLVLIYILLLILTVYTFLILFQYWVYYLIL